MSAVEYTIPDIYEFEHFVNSVNSNEELESLQIQYTNIMEIIKGKITEYLHPYGLTVDDVIMLEDINGDRDSFHSKPECFCPRTDSGPYVILEFCGNNVPRLFNEVDLRDGICMNLIKDLGICSSILFYIIDRKTYVHGRGMVRTMSIKKKIKRSAEFRMFLLNWGVRSILDGVNPKKSYGTRSL